MTRSSLRRKPKTGCDFGVGATGAGDRRRLRCRDKPTGRPELVRGFGNPPLIKHWVLSRWGCAATAVGATQDDRFVTV